MFSIYLFICLFRLHCVRVNCLYTVKSALNIWFRVVFVHWDSLLCLFVAIATDIAIAVVVVVIAAVAADD